MLKKQEKPTLTISKPFIKFGSPLNFSFSGFPPNTPVYVYSDGNGVDTKVSDASGGGLSYFTGNELPGSHVLKAKDSFGHKATVSFIVE